MEKIFSAFGLLFVIALAISPTFAVAQVLTTPYWCGWGWSSVPCHSLPAYGYTNAYPYHYGYAYTNNYGYDYSFGYSNNYPCYPVSYDSRGVVVQTSCGFVNVAYPNQNQYSQPYYPNYPQYQPNYQWNWQEHHWHTKYHDTGWHTYN